MVSLLTQISLSYAVLKVKELINTGVCFIYYRNYSLSYYMVNSAIYNRVYYWI